VHVFDGLTFGTLRGDQLGVELREAGADESESICEVDLPLNDTSWEACQALDPGTDYEFQLSVGTEQFGIPAVTDSGIVPTSVDLLEK
jgi:hypothetical protein